MALGAARPSGQRHRVLQGRGLDQLRSPQPAESGLRRFTFILYGLAVAFSDTYPRCLGWTAAAGGAGGAASGVIQSYIGEPVGITTALGIAAPTVITLWLIAMGILVFRKGRGPGIQ